LTGNDPTIIQQINLLQKDATNNHHPPQLQPQQDTPETTPNTHTGTHTGTTLTGTTFTEQPKDVTLPAALCQDKMHRRAIHEIIPKLYPLLTTSVQPLTKQIVITRNTQFDRLRTYPIQSTTTTTNITHHPQKNTSDTTSDGNTTSNNTTSNNGTAAAAAATVFYLSKDDIDALTTYWKVPPSSSSASSSMVLRSTEHCDKDGRRELHRILHRLIGKCFTTGTNQHGQITVTRKKQRTKRKRGNNRNNRDSTSNQHAQHHTQKNGLKKRKTDGNAGQRTYLFRGVLEKYGVDQNDAIARLTR